MIPNGLSISLSNPACSVDSFEATPAQGIKRCRPISESPFGWSSGELIQLIHLKEYILLVTTMITITAIVAIIDTMFILSFFS